MCGICGFVGEGDTSILSSMAEVLQSRGPDGQGLWEDSRLPVFLGHRRLSIVDIHDGFQPMWTVDQQIGIVFNGEIYNHKSLRKDLESKGHKFQSGHSDTEVLLHGYREWGHGLLDRLNGMWAFALYDRKKNKLWLSRDRFGKKPLYYASLGSTFIFASELKSILLHPRVERTFDQESLKKYFAHGYVPAPRSIIKGVSKLPAGHNLLLDIKDKTFHISRYWRLLLDPFTEVPKDSEEEWGESIRELLNKSVKQRMVADVPVGVFLSGGVDSSSIISMALSGSIGEDVRTFSIGFEESSFDESSYSSELANIFGTKHKLEMLSANRTHDLLDDIVEQLDEPMADSSLIPSYLLCQTARKDVTVALGGDGADELFAGYDPFIALSYAKVYDRFIPKPVHSLIRQTMSLLPVSHRNMSLDFRIKRTLDGLSYPSQLWNPVWIGILPPEQLERLFGGSVDLNDLYAESVDAWESCPQENLIDKTLQYYTEMYLQNDILVKMDRAGMMNSLEVRSPYLDKDFVDFIRRIPSSYKHKKNETKYILKKALHPVLPLDILYRSKKGFGVPIGQWFKDGSLRVDETETLSMLDPQFVHQAYEEHCSGKKDWRSFLWAYWLLNRWSKLHQVGG